jgi:hypothetical protein
MPAKAASLASNGSSIEAWSETGIRSGDGSWSGDSFSALKPAGGRTYTAGLPGSADPWSAAGDRTTTEAGVQAWLWSGVVGTLGTLGVSTTGGKTVNDAGTLKSPSDSLGGGDGGESVAWDPGAITVASLTSS